MKSNSETGNWKTLSAFEQLIVIITALGTAYNPSQTLIKLATLLAQYATGKAAMDTYFAKNTTYNNATNTREIAFAAVKLLCTRILGGFESSGAKEQTVKDLKHYLRKIRGKRAGSLKTISTDASKAISTDATPDATVTTEVSEKQHSTAQLSFDSLIEHFANIIEVLAAEATYTPNESDLKVTALQATLADLKAKNTAVMTAYTNLTNARINRDKILYGEDTGIVDTAKEVKSYVKSIYGVTSPQYKQVNSLHFRNR